MSEAASSPIKEGDLLAGKYRVERVLGVGGMGIVVAARHEQLDQPVAIKFVREDALGNEQAVARFLREARACVKLRSDHAAKVLDVGTLESGAPYMVMEYLEGADLGAVLGEQGALSVETTAGYVVQACEALAEAQGDIATALPEAVLDGVLVGPMLTGGIELLVGVVTDPTWGKVLSLGLGGVWVEVLGDVALRVLPVARDEITTMLSELRGATLLSGARGTRPVDMDRLVTVIYQIAQLAEGLGDALDTLEVNPLRVEGGDVEVLDALAMWRNEGEMK